MDQVQERFGSPSLVPIHPPPHPVTTTFHPPPAPSSPRPHSSHPHMYLRGLVGIQSPLACATKRSPHTVVISLHALECHLCNSRCVSFSNSRTPLETSFRHHMVPVGLDRSPSPHYTHPCPYSTFPQSYRVPTCSHGCWPLPGSGRPVQAFLQAGQAPTLVQRTLWHLCNSAHASPASGGTGLGSKISLNFKLFDEIL